MGVSRARCAGFIGLALAAGSVAVALVRHYGWGDASAVVTVIGLPIAVVGLNLAWVGLLRPVPPSPADLAAVADLLAAAVKAQWTAEAEVRQLNDPYALSVARSAGGPFPRPLRY